MIDAKKIHGMIGVEKKPETLRTARASGQIILSEELLQKIKDKQIPKGDVFEQSRIAGVMAAKKTHEWIPLCHPLRLTNVQIDFQILSEGINVTSSVTAIDRTGVEMEALTAVSATCLNIYDMCKKFDRNMEIKDIHLLEKTGGVSGRYSGK